MKKTPFVTKQQVEEIVKKFPTPFHLYDEAGIRANAQAVKDAFRSLDGFEIVETTYQGEWVSITAKRVK